MSEKTATVRIWPPQTDVLDRGAVTRVYTEDLALIGEAASGEALQVPLGRGYVADAVNWSGQAIGLPQRFDVASMDGTQDLHLKPRPGERLMHVRSAALDRDVQIIESAISPAHVSDVGTRVLVTFRPGSLQIEPSANAPPNDKPPDLPEERLCLTFPGPGELRRYALVPFDSKHGSWVVPRILWSSAKTEGYELPVFEFKSALLTSLQEALGNRQPLVARGFASRGLADMAEDAISDKLESVLAAVLGGLLLLQDAPERLPTIEPWTRTLFERCPQFPDALPLRADLLAKLGRHREAQELLRRLPERGVPWTRRGLRTLAERLQFYNQRERGDDVVAGWTQWAQYLLAMSHPACVFCVFEIGAKG